MSQEVVVAAEKERAEGPAGSPRASPGPAADEEEWEEDQWEDVDEEEEDEEEEGQDEDRITSLESPSIALSSSSAGNPDHTQRGGGLTKASEGTTRSRLEINRLVALMRTVLEVCEETLVVVTKSMAVESRSHTGVGSNQGAKSGSDSKSGSGVGLGLWVTDDVLRSSPVGALLPLVLFTANALFKEYGDFMALSGGLPQLSLLFSALAKCHSALTDHALMKTSSLLHNHDLDGKGTTFQGHITEGISNTRGGSGGGSVPIVVEKEFESPHPYLSSMDTTTEIEFPGATRLEISFDPASRTESGCDFVVFKTTTGDCLHPETERLVSNALMVTNILVVINILLHGSDSIMLLSLPLPQPYPNPNLTLTLTLSKPDPNAIFCRYSGRDGNQNWPGCDGREPLVLENVTSLVCHFHSDSSVEDWGYKFVVAAHMPPSDAVQVHDSCCHNDLLVIMIVVVMMID